MGRRRWRRGDGGVAHGGRDGAHSDGEGEGDDVEGRRDGGEAREAIAGR